jgi:hypothetical protein
MPNILREKIFKRKGFMGSRPCGKKGLVISSLFNSSLIEVLMLK